jgi:hypothetical protein
MKAKRRTPLGKAIVEHVGQVLSKLGRDTCTLHVLLLDLRNLEQYVSNDTLDDW